MPNPFTLLPSPARKIIYIVYGIFALVVGGVDVFFGSNDPSWMEGAQNVVAYLALPVGALAASNTPASPAEVEEKAEEIIEEEHGEHKDDDPWADGPGYDPDRLI